MPRRHAAVLASLVGAVALAVACVDAPDLDDHASDALAVAPTLDLVQGFVKPVSCPGRVLPVADGTVYGTACGGGLGSGALFARAADGTVTVLHYFRGDDGAEPYGLARAADGTLYGATRGGGAHGRGTLYRWQAGALTKLHDLGPTDGKAPTEITLGSDGALYGTTREGGAAGFGTLFRWSVGGGFVTLHAFDRTTGSYPYAGVVEAAGGGVFYGTTNQGGALNRGTLFRWSAGGGLTTLHAFTGGADGAGPYWGRLAEGVDGALYGTTTTGGAGKFGTLYRWTSGSGLATLRAFTYAAEGGYAYGGVVVAADGALYGATSVGGGATSRCGVVFRWTAAGGLARLHDFTCTGGANPEWGVVLAPDGLLYGGTRAGGHQNAGTLFRLATTGGATFASLHAFDQATPRRPSGRVVVEADGAVHGTTVEGGASGLGTIYRSSGGALSVLHAFGGTADGAAPEAGLTRGADGALYGTTIKGGSGCGTVFRWQAGVGLTTLRVLDRATTGCNPYGGLLRASDGALYGTTSAGGAAGGGTLFRWDGAFTVLHAFVPATDGASPFYNGVVEASDGALYGTTSAGGPGGGGTLFRWDGALTVLHAFAYDGAGAAPSAGVVEGADGALYGTTSYGGAGDLGTLFRWSSGGGLTTLRAFGGGADGANPYLPLVRRTDGTLLGAIEPAAGATGPGSIFAWTPSASTFATAATLATATGASPSAWLVDDGASALYGTAWKGGPDGGGALFRLTVGPPALVSIAVTPPIASVAKGLARAFTATGTYADGATADLTDEVTWTSSATGFATISNAAGSEGVALGVGVGGATISATLDGVTGTAALTVTAPALVSIAVTPASASVAKGLTRAFAATGTYTDGSTADLTALATWSSSAPAIATVSNAAGAQGVATGAAVGAATITATIGAVAGSASLTVTVPTLVSIAVTPVSASIAKGLAQAFVATGTYTDGSTAALTTTATWTSSAPAIATVSNAAGTQGRASGVAVGAATITATIGAVAGSASLTVTAPTLVSIAVTPASASIAKGLTQAFVATGTYTDGSTAVVTTTATWTTSAPAIATVSNAAGTQGRASGVAVGAATITATVGAVAGSASLTVTAPTLASIAVTPANPSIAKGTTTQFVATGTYSDATTQNLTTSVTWSTSNAAIATVSNVAGAQGRATGVATGAATITATLGARAGSTTLTVTAAVLEEIDVQPVDPTLAKGTSSQFVAIGTFSDGTTQDLTASATWSSANGAIATVSNVAGSKGMVTAVAVGTTAIQAAVGAVSEVSDVTVSAATLSSIAITPVAPTVPDGLTVAFTATGTYSDGSTQNITTLVAWSSSATGVATVSNVAGSQGVATGVAPGTATITATLAGRTASRTLTVTAATLVSIAVTPAAVTVPVGFGQQYAAVGTYSDGTTQDLTTTATWASSDGAVATISNAAGSRGLASIAGAGTTTISATLNGVTGSTTLTGTAAVLLSIAVTPSGTTNVPRGTTLQLTAIGTFAGGLTQDITTQVSWSSGKKKSASVTATGLVTGIKSSGATITIRATLSGRTGTKAIKVTP